MQQIRKFQRELCTSRQLIIFFVQREHERESKKILCKKQHFESGAGTLRRTYKVLTDSGRLIFG
jgi:hypothetical protein